MALADLAEMSRAMEALVEQAAARVVSIADADGGRVSGMVWRTGQVIAAHEVLADADEFLVTLPGGPSVKGMIAGRDPSTDVALIRAETGDFGDWDAAPLPRVGALAVVVGRGEGSVLATHGMIGEAGPAWRSMRGGEIDARLTLSLRLPSRCEGGAVVDAQGGLIGMAATGARGRAIAIPAATVERSVKTLAVKGYVPRRYLGLSLHPLEGQGVIIVGLAEGGPGEAAGLAIGDIVTTWDGTAIGGVRDLFNRLAGSAVGQTARLGVTRGGNAIDIQIVVGERPRP